MGTCVAMKGTHFAVGISNVKCYYFSPFQNAPSGVDWKSFSSSPSKTSKCAFNYRQVNNPSGVT